MERKIDEVFSTEDGTTLKVVECSNCDQCYFFGDCGCTLDAKDRDCENIDREDDTNVIFMQVGRNPTDDFKTRLKKECEVLTEKITKLKAFFDTETYKGLDADNRGLLCEQLSVMQDYEEILKRRISLLCD